MKNSLAVFVIGGWAAAIGFASADTVSGPPRLSRQNADLQIGPAMNAAGRTLFGCEFPGANLRDADFSGADLRGASFEQSFLTGANFRQSIIDLSVTGSWIEPSPIGVIEGADFTDASISWGRGRAAASNFSLSPSQLRSTRNYHDKKMANMRILADVDGSEGYDFSHADLRGTALVGDGDNDFSRANFEGARIDGLVLVGSCLIPFEVLAKARNIAGRTQTSSETPQHRSLYGIDWSQGRVRGVCDFSGMTLRECHITAFYCDRLLLDETLLIESQCSHLESRHLARTLNLKRGDFSKLSFHECDFEGMDWSECDLSGMFFDKTNLTNADFTNSVISHVNFGVNTGMSQSTCKGLTAKRIRQTWNFKHGRMETVVLPAALRSELGLPASGK